MWPDSMCTETRLSVLCTGTHLPDWRTVSTTRRSSYFISVLVFRPLFHVCSCRTESDIAISPALVRERPTSGTRAGLAPAAKAVSVPALEAGSAVLLVAGALAVPVAVAVVAVSIGVGRLE